MDLLEQLNKVEQERDLLCSAVKKLLSAVAPFTNAVERSSGRIPTELLSFDDWHELGKAEMYALECGVKLMEAGLLYVLTSPLRGADK